MNMRADIRNVGSSGYFAEDGTRSLMVKDSFYSNHLKRVFDLVLVIATLPFSIMVIAVLAALVVLTGQAPFYTQRRIGKNRRVFRMLKLQTMKPNAEEDLKAYLVANPDAQAEWSRTQKLKHDPRVTRIGRILRKSSLDELPQLWNVLIGDMSLVGPRPMMEDQVDLYDGDAYFQLRPGVTGMWQVSMRNSSAFADRVKFDDDYGQAISFGCDISILFQTVRAVVRRTGY